MKERLSGLDSLRAIGALMILLFHLTYAIDFPEYLTVINIYFQLGVQLFLIVSAFSLFYGYYERLNNREEIRKYMIRRFLRIAPIFYLMLAVWGITYYIGGIEHSFSEYLINITFIFNFFPGEHLSIIGAGWIISVFLYSICYCLF